MNYIWNQLEWFDGEYDVPDEGETVLVKRESRVLAGLITLDLGMWTHKDGWRTEEGDELSGVIEWAPMPEVETEEQDDEHN